MKFFTELSKAWKKNEPKDFMTDKEIAALLDLSEKTVSVRLSRGRQKLRKALEEAENYA